MVVELLTIEEKSLVAKEKPSSKRGEKMDPEEFLPDEHRIAETRLHLAPENFGK